MQKNSKSESGIFAPRILLACALCMLSALLGAFSFGASASVGSASGGNWSISPSPDVTAQGLGNVTCVSATDCWTVGSYVNEDNFRQTLIEHWGGSAWSVVSSPNVSATESDYLRDVSCTSASNCWAVGRRSVTVNSIVTDYTLTEHWDGSVWSIVASPNANGNNRLNGVTCMSATDCWAAGYYSNGTLIEHWDGSLWAIVASPNAAGTGNRLYSVTCASTTDCWAVGYYSSGSYKQTVIEHWNGSAWSIVSSPNTSATERNYLYGVTCTSPTNCWGVGFSSGNSDDQTLIAHWDGNIWSKVSSPNVSGNSQLYNVTCASASDCWAVGYAYTINKAIATHSLVEHWNGAAWSVMTSPSANFAENSEFFGVTCASASQCWTVGDINIKGTLIEQWNGSSWSSAASPIISGGGITNVLSGVSCNSISDCWAVGNYTGIDYGTITQTLIEHWNGSAWSILPSPNTSVTEDNYLNRVTCTSASDCWAVGDFFDPFSYYKTLTEHWNGAAWTIISSPTPTADVDLNDIACTSTSDCWAVGDFLSSGADPTLIEHWNGSAWAIVTSPNGNPTGSNSLHGVNCTSTTQCWAVGDYYDTARHTLIERWDGNAWSIVSSPNTTMTQNNSFSSVTCTSASDCWAVGNYYDDSIRSHTLVAHWDGVLWSLVPSPYVTGTDVFLAGVTCASTSNCWATGKYSDTSVSQAANMRWDGASWSFINTPSTNTADANELRSVSCPTTSRCWAVGYYRKPSGIGQTLIEEFTPIPPLTNVVSRMSHVGAGTFDVDLGATTTPTIECRSGGPGGNYTLVFNFTNPLASVDGVTASATSPSGPQPVANSGIIGVDPHQYFVSLSGVPNAQHITISLTRVQDAQGNIGDLSQRFDVLIGDTTNDGTVNSGDIAQTKSQSGIAVTTSNFREDVTADGSVNSGDIALTKSKSGTALP